MSAPQTLKDYISQYNQKKEISDLQERHETMNIESPNKNFFTKNLIVDIFVFATAIILALATIIILYLLCKHNKLRMLVASLVLHQIREVGTSAMKDDANNICSCTSQFYIILALSVYIFGLVFFAILQARKIQL